MPMYPDEEDFDSSLPPWVYADGAGMELPEAMLSEDAGPSQADPQGLEMEAPQPWRPESQSRQEPGDRKDQLAMEFRQEQPRTRSEARRDASRETHRARRDEVEGQRKFQKDVVRERERIHGGAQAQAWRPPIFDQFQEVKAMAGAEDEIPLGDPMTIARADPTVDMNNAMDLAEAASQNADVAAEQSRYLHNAMSRLRDTEVGFMTRNYV